MKKSILCFNLFTIVGFATLTSCNNEELKRLKDENAILKNELDSIKTTIKEEEEKKRFFGMYKLSGKGLYKSFDFKGETSVVVTDNFIGFPFATSYERDGKIIRIRTDKSDLMLTVQDDKTLIGDGFADGTYTKTEK
jgi:hypothetical protein